MHDLDRLFHQLVTTLAASDPGSLNRPVSLRDNRESVMPDRTSPRPIGVDTG